MKGSYKLLVNGARQIGLVYDNRMKGSYKCCANQTVASLLVYDNRMKGSYKRRPEIAT